MHRQWIPGVTRTSITVVSKFPRKAWEATHAQTMDPRRSSLISFERLGTRLHVAQFVDHSPKLLGQSLDHTGLSWDRHFPLTPHHIILTLVVPGLPWDYQLPWYPCVRVSQNTRVTPAGIILGLPTPLCQSYKGESQNSLVTHPCVRNVVVTLADPRTILLTL